jgi:hypothetical protein
LIKGACTHPEMPAVARIVDSATPESLIPTIMEAVDSLAAKGDPLLPELYDPARHGTLRDL